MNDLAAELVEAYGALNPVARQWLRDKGVPDIAMVKYPGIGIARVEIHDDLFDFVDVGGVRMFVMPVSVAGIYSDIIDAIAWRASDPSRWWLNTGAGVALGADCIDTAMVFDVPLRVFQTPLSWFCNQGAGLCVLDWPAMRLDVEEVAAGAGIIPEDINQGDEIERHLIPPRPDFNILIWSAAE